MPVLRRVTFPAGAGRIRSMAKSQQRTRGMSLTELLCVIAIIAILAALYLGGIAKAFVHIKKFLDGN